MTTILETCIRAGKWPLRIRVYEIAAITTGSYGSRNAGCVIYLRSGAVFDTDAVYDTVAMLLEESAGLGLS